MNCSHKLVFTFTFCVEFLCTRAAAAFDSSFSRGVRTSMHRERRRRRGAAPGRRASVFVAHSASLERRRCCLSGATKAPACLIGACPRRGTIRGRALLACSGALKGRLRRAKAPTRGSLTLSAVVGQTLESTGNTGLFESRIRDERVYRGSLVAFIGGFGSRSCPATTGRTAVAVLLALQQHRRSSSRRIDTAGRTVTAPDGKTHRWWLEPEPGGKKKARRHRERAEQPDGVHARLPASRHPLAR